MRKHNPTLFTLSERSDSINDDDDGLWQHEKLDPALGPSTSNSLVRGPRSGNKGRFFPQATDGIGASGKNPDIYSQFVQRYRTKEHRSVDELDELRSDPDSHYFHRGLGQLVDVGDASDDEDSMSMIGGNDGMADGTGEFELAHPVTEKEQDRLNWQSLLSSVLSGEVLKSEKTRIAVVLDSLGDEQNNLHVNLWLGIRAKFHACSVEEERRKLEEKRVRIVDSVINEIMTFKVNVDDPAYRSDPATSALEQVTTLLHRLDVAQSLYPHLKAFYLDKPKAQEGPFQSRCDTLNTWFTILASLKRHFARLRRWTGSDSLDVNHPNPNPEILLGNRGNTNNSHLSPDQGDGTSFVERLLKEESMQRTFEKGFLVTVHAFLGTVRDAHVNLASQFREMNLPTFESELVPLISFPTKLAQAGLRLRLDYVAKLREPEVLIIDQMTEDLKLSIGLACTLKRQYEAFLAPDPDGNWNLPQCISEDYDSTILEALSCFFQLLHWKLKSGTKGIYLKETDVLEAQWATYNDVSLTAGGSSLVAEQLCSLTNKLLARVANYFDTQVRVPLSDNPRAAVQPKGGSNAKNPGARGRESQDVAPAHKMTEEQIINWYNKILDGVRLRYRKLQRFARVLTQRFHNSAEYGIDDVQMESLISLLVLSDHFLVYTQTMEEDSIYIVASGSLFDRPHLIRRMLMEAFHVDEVTNEEGARAVGTEYLMHDSDEVGYLLALTPQAPFIWNGRVQIVPVPNVSLDVKEGRIRLIADGSYRRLTFAKQVFNDSMELIDESNEHGGPGPVYLTCLVEAQAHLPSVNRELRKIVRATNRLAEYIVDSVEHVKSSLSGAAKSCIQDLLGNWYLFATEHGAHAQKYMEKAALVRFNRSLVKLAISWVTFVCDDCDPNDRKTFRWAVNALEFTMQRTKRNILQLPDEQFDSLRHRVAICMTLLISHFDILGARSNLEARIEKERQDMLLRLQVSGVRSDKEEDFPPLSDGHEDWHMDVSTKQYWERVSKSLGELEERTIHVIPQHKGKVLDDEKLEDRSLVFLASSSSNISIRWQQGRFIGAGAFGSVYLAMNLDSGSLMAVKEIKFQELTGLPNLYAQIKDELSVMEMLHHPNVVEYYGIEVHRDKVYIFEEYCQGGSLAALLEHGRIEDERILQLYTVQMLDGLAYLHSQGIVHRDIKPDNILLDHLGIIKYVDFGAAKILAKNQRTMQKSRRPTDASNHVPNANGIGVMSNGLTGTPMYMSPEMIKNDKRGRYGATDIWSLGCVILQCATGKKPWSNLDNEWAIMFHIGVSTQHPPLPEPGQLSSIGVDFIKQCLIIDPTLRPSANELMTHAWMIDVRGVLEKLTDDELEAVASPRVPLEESMEYMSTPQTLPLDL